MSCPERSTCPARRATSPSAATRPGGCSATLAATRGGTMAEFGTGCGVGTAPGCAPASRGDGADRDRRSWTRTAPPRPPPRSSPTTPRSRCSPRTGRRCSTRARSRCCSSTPASPTEVGVDADRRPGRAGRHRRTRRLHAVRGLAPDRLRPRRHPARAVAHRRAASPPSRCMVASDASAHDRHLGVVLGGFRRRPSRWCRVPSR